MKITKSVITNRIKERLREPTTFNDLNFDVLEKYIYDYIVKLRFVKSCKVKLADDRLDIVVNSVNIKYYFSGWFKETVEKLA